jgi:tryptophan-rich sensory protein
MKAKDIGLLIVCILITLGAGGLGGFATATSIDGWYSTINKPSFNPPNYLFGPVWTILYFLMGFALYTIIKLPKSPQKSRMVFIFGSQLILNTLWSFLFFKFHMIGLAAIEMFILWLFILAMILGLFKFNKTIAAIQIPYLVWVTFAFILNSTIYFIN